MMEAGVVFNSQGDPIYWHLPGSRTSVALPDSRDLWDVLWENRNDLGGFAHSHPGSGTPGPSYEDVTTFAAIEAALGKRLAWWIISEDAVVVTVWEGPNRLSYGHPVEIEYAVSPDWLTELRRVSYPHKMKGE